MVQHLWVKKSQPQFPHLLFDQAKEFQVAAGDVGLGVAR